MIEFIDFAKSENGAKFALWRLADYRYQIDIAYKEITTQIELNLEYYDALEKFNEVVENFNSGASENV